MKRKQETGEASSKLEDPSLKQSYRGHSGAVRALVCNGNQAQIISGSDDSSVIVWNLGSKKLRPFKFIGHKGPVLDVGLHPNGKTIVSGSRDQTVRLWSNSVDGRSSVISAHNGAVRSVDISADGNFILTGSEDKSIKIWKWVSRKFECSLLGHRNWVLSSRFSPDARLVVSGGEDKLVKLWDVAQRNCISSFSDHIGSVNCVRFHTDGTCIASAASDGKVKVFDVRSQRVIQHYDAHNDRVNSIAFHPSQNYLISASADSTLKVLDLRQGLPIYTLYGHESEATALSFTKNGKSFASGGKDAVVMLWRSNLIDNSDIDTRTALDKVLLPPHPGMKSKLGDDTFRSTGIRSMRQGLTFSGTKREEEEFNTRDEGDEAIVEEAKAATHFTSLPPEQYRNVNYDKLPLEFANDLHKSIHQLDIISRTVALLQQRVQKCEEQGKMLNSYVQEAMQSGNENLDPQIAAYTPLKLMSENSQVSNQLSAMRNLTEQLRGNVRRLEESTTAIAPPPTSQKEFATPAPLYSDLPPSRLFVQSTDPLGGAASFGQVAGEASQEDEGLAPTQPEFE